MTTCLLTCYLVAMTQFCRGLSLEQCPTCGNHSQAVDDVLTAHRPRREESRLYRCLKMLTSDWSECREYLQRTSKGTPSSNWQNQRDGYELTPFCFIVLISLRKGSGKWSGELVSFFKHRCSNVVVSILFSRFGDLIVSVEEMSFTYPVMYDFFSRGSDWSFLNIVTVFLWGGGKPLVSHCFRRESSRLSPF